MLKDLRKKVARQHDLPPFVIFQDPSLEDMAVQYPITIEEMQNITGVGVGKARKFGEEFVKLIKAYVEEKEIIPVVFPMTKDEAVLKESHEAAVKSLAASWIRERPWRF